MHLQATDIEKSFDDNVVLRGVNLGVGDGEIVGLVGENGAGKSTLTRILAGAYSPDAGTVSIDGEPQHFKGPRDAMQRGIQVIYQEFRHSLFPHRSVTENLFVRGEHRPGGFWLNKARMARSAHQAMANLGISVDLDRSVGSLGAAEQQMVEIAKAINQELGCLILDEPTAALDDQESDRLFAQVRRLRDDGVSILYISHRLDEVFELTDRIVVLRDGQVALEAKTSDTSPDRVVAAMVGRTVDDFYPKERNVGNDVRLHVEDLSSAGLFTEVSFDVHAGEVLGLAGVFGSGRGDVLRVLFGLRPRDSGNVTLDGRSVHPRRPAQAIAAGIGYLAPERGAEALLPAQPVSANITLAALRQYTNSLGFVRRGKERAAVDESMRSLRVRASSAEIPIASLSGGNQQKAMFARWLLVRPGVLLMEEPTRGVDVGAKTEIYRIINELTASGVAVVMVSADLPELVAMSDRVLVMRSGRVVAELEGESLDQEAVLAQALEVSA